MSGRYHVLLVGIDLYEGDGSLDGCVNDIDAIQRFLVDKVGVPLGSITRLASPIPGATHEIDVPERTPTLANIAAELERLGTDVVGSGDRVFIYYSGHGTFANVASRDGYSFSREALLPQDKIAGLAGTERRYLFDWQLNRLIAAITARTPRVTVVLDCCCAAGLTRDVEAAPRGKERYHESRAAYRLGAVDRWNGDLVRGMSIALGSVPSCLLVAACRDDERAREELVPGSASSRGVLTQALLTALGGVEAGDLPRLRWGRIWRAIEAAVRAANPRQTAYIAGGFGRLVFGFGADEDSDPGYQIAPAAGGYELDVGQLQGVTPGAEIGVYGEQPLRFAPLGTLEDRNSRVGVVRVTAAGPARCTAVAPPGFALPTAPRGRLVKAGAGARLRLLTPPAALAGYVPADLMEIVAGGEDIALKRCAGGWAICDDVHGTGAPGDGPRLVAIPADRPSLAKAVLEHYYAYTAPIRLARNCRDLPSQLQMWLLDCNGRTLGAEEAQDPPLPRVEGGAHGSYEAKVGARVCVIVANTSAVSLSVTLLDCATSGRVQLLGEAVVPARGRRAFWSCEVLGQPWSLALPARERDVGIDRFVAIGSTRRSSLAYLARAESFDDIIDPKRGARGFSLITAPPPELWTSAMIALRISRQ